MNQANLQHKQSRAVQIRHIFSTIKDVQYKQVNHQVLVQGGGHYSRILSNE